MPALSYLATMSLARRTASLAANTASLASARRGLCSSSRLAGLLKATPAGQAIVWMAPCAQTFKPEAATSPGSKFVFHDQVDPAFFTGPDVPDDCRTIVVSAQTVAKPFLQAWRERCPHQQEQQLRIVRRGTSLGSIDMDAAKELGIDVANTPGVNSPHVAQFVVETLGLTVPMDPQAGHRHLIAASDPKTVKAVVVGAGSVGQSVVALMKRVGVEATVVNRSPESPSLEAALRGATHVAVCAATSGEPIITAAHTKELFAGEKRTVKICSVSRPEAFSLEAILMVAQQAGQAQLRFDYGDSTLAPMREKVNQDGVKANVTWTSKAMASEACKQDMDEAVLNILV